MDSLDRLISAWLSQMSWSGEALVRLALAALLGSMIGLEREVRGRQAGFRTNLLVCLGSAMVMLVSIRLTVHPWEPLGDYIISVDPGRIAYGVMTGIGFLGAGAILKQQETVRGLTTAAGLWCVAAIGLAVGYGLYTLGVSGAVLVLLALWLLQWVENVLPKRVYRRIVVRCPWRGGIVSQVMAQIERQHISIMDHGFRRIEDLGKVDIEISISYRDPATYRGFVQTIFDDAESELISSELTR
jgi:putative Mg2+ transporter-C (MgtC) family protein